MIFFSLFFLIHFLNDLAPSDLELLIHIEVVQISTYLVAKLIRYKSIFFYEKTMPELAKLSALQNVIAFYIDFKKHLCKYIMH